MKTVVNVWYKTNKGKSVSETADVYHFNCHILNCLNSSGYFIVDITRKRQVVAKTVSVIYGPTPVTQICECQQFELDQTLIYWFDQRASGISN